MKQLLKYIENLLLEQLKYVETKHSVAIALSGGLVLYLAQMIDQNHLITSIFSFVAIALLIFSIINSMSALTSRRLFISNNKKYKSSINILYFKDISNQSVEGFLNSICIRYNFEKYSWDNFDYDLSSEIIANAKIIDIKFSLFNRSALFIGLSSFFAMLAVIFNGFGI